MKSTNKSIILDSILSRKRLSNSFDYVTCDDINHNIFEDIVDFYALINGHSRFIWKDKKGEEKKSSNLLSALINIQLDFALWPVKLLKIKGVVSKLERQKEVYFNAKSHSKCIYLRTDHWFNLVSGGSVGHTAGVINALQHLNIETKVYSTDKLIGIENEKSIHVIEPNYSRYKNIPELPDMLYGIELPTKIKETSDFIYQRYSLGNLSGVILKYKTQRPLVLEYNGSFVWMANHWGGSKMIHKELIGRIEMLNFKHADLIVVVSEASAHELHARGVNKNKILVNPNGVNPNQFSPEINGQEIREQYQLENKKVGGFIGTFSHWHGVLTLADSIKLFFENHKERQEDAAFLLIGNGKLWMECKKKLEGFSWSKNVIFTGEIKQELGPSYLAACDYYLSPHVPNPDGTPFFGSPTKLFEYMAMGKPIIASNLDQIGKILKDKETAMLCEPTNANELAETMNSLVTNYKENKHLGVNARAELLNKYSWNKHVEKILSKLENKA